MPSTRTLLGITPQIAGDLAVGTIDGVEIGSAVGGFVLPTGAGTHLRLEPEPIDTNP